MPTFVEVSAAQRIREASELVPDGGGIGGWAAAHWHGSPFFDGTRGDGTLLPVLVCLGSEGAKRQRIAGIDVSRDRLPADDLCLVNKLVCTTPLRTAFDLARRARSLSEGVAAVDTLLECGLVDQVQFADYVDQHRGWAGIARARVVVTLCRPGVRSPMESGTRIVWEVTAGYPRLLLNVPVFSIDGLLLGIADMMDEASATVIEYDGADHREPERFAADRRRDQLFRDHGLQIVRVSDDDMRGSRDSLIERFGQARQLGLRRDVSLDRWTLRLPPGWTPPE